MKKDEHFHIIVNLRYLKELMENLITKMNSDLPPEKRRGGAYVSIFDAETGELVICFAVGDFPPEKAAKYQEYSLGKGKQLFRHLSEGHTNSSESADEGYPEGAVYVEGSEYISSVSGQEPQNDTKLSLANDQMLRKAEYFC
jgi:hypothetical protein